MKCCIVTSQQNIAENIILLLQSIEPDMKVDITSSLDAPLKLVNGSRHELLIVDLNDYALCHFNLESIVEDDTPVILIGNKGIYRNEVDFNIMGFIDNPIHQDELNKLYNKSKRYLSKMLRLQSGYKHLFVKHNSKFVRINTENILYVKSERDYVNIKTIEGDFLINSSLKNIESKLPCSEFMRVHRSFIIRLDRVNSIQNNMALIEDKCISISKPYQGSFYERIKLVN